MKIFRAMAVDADGRPQVGPSARKLGVRGLEAGRNADVPVADPTDVVTPGSGGMSVAPHSATNLPPLRRPATLGGSGRDPVWVLETDDLETDLRFRQDSGTHGLIEPATDMTRDEYEAALARTREKWVQFTQ